MQHKSIGALFLGVLFVMFSSSASEESGWKLPEDMIVQPHLYGHFQSGQIVQGNLKFGDYVLAGNGDKPQIDHIWFEEAVVEAGFDALYGKNLKLGFTMGSKLYFSYPVFYNTEQYTKNMRQDVYLGDLYAQYHYGDGAIPLLLGEVGYFKFKYNPDGRNFGDYLFRTGTYPIWFDMSFDNPWQRLLGFHGQTNPVPGLKMDLLFISSTIAPAMDWSLAGLADYDIANLHFINIGAGVDFARLFSVYTDHYNTTAGGSPTQPQEKNHNSRYVAGPGDTAYYTFKGTKVMGRFSIDPKIFLPFADIFGKNDLKLYAEADIIGLKSYPDSGINGLGDKYLAAPSYNKLFEKMPVAMGFNLPAFKLLDVLNGEFEWFSARYYNDPTNLISKGSTPLPNTVNWWTDTSLHLPKKSFLKWSVYAKRSFSNGHFSIIGQIGRDHMRLPCASYSNEMWNELLVTEKDWAWYLKTSWMF